MLVLVLINMCNYIICIIIFLFILSKDFLQRILGAIELWDSKTSRILGRLFVLNKPGFGNNVSGHSRKCFC